jgi:hypothetical protein
MIRNLKVLFAAAMALTAFGAIAANAHAAEEFHCSVEPCRARTTTDGTGATAHHVFIVENAAKTESVSFTCESFRGEARTAVKNTTELTFAWPNTTLRPNHDREAYDNCKVNGSPGVEVHMNTCEYKFKSAGGSTGTAHVSVVCPGTAKIEIRIPTGGIFTIGSQELNGIGYHTIGTSPNRETTVTANVTNIVTTCDGTKATCLIDPAQTLTGTYTTGNTIVTAEEDLTEAEEITEHKTPVMADGWFE